MSTSEVLERAEWAKRAVGQPMAVVTDAVERSGGTYRVVCRDGRHSVCTQDFNPNRANLTVMGGIVTAVHFG